MYLFRRKIKGKSINHPLGKIKDLPINVDNTHLNTLLEQLKQGNKYVIDEILRSHIRIAINIASQYAILIPNKTNDLVSEAMLAIMNCCSDPNDIQNLTAYIISKIHSALAKYIDEDNTIRIPASTIYKNHRQNLVQVALRDHSHRSKVSEIQDMINASIKTEQERQIIALRAQCYVDREIANITGLSTQRIAQIRSDVYRRFQLLEQEI